jgi:hypothetical protein
VADLQPRRLNVWLCPVCSGKVTLQVPVVVGQPQPGEYELGIGADADGKWNDGWTRGVYLTEADALDCLQRHADEHAAEQNAQAEAERYACRMEGTDG